MKYKITIVAFFIILLSFLAWPGKILAQETAQAADVNYSANVVSLVSATYSHIELNAQETLADPVNHPLLLTVTLLDESQKPLSNKDVAVSSNRGRIDIIEAISDISAYKAHAAEDEAVTDKTDHDGEVKFRITSFVPGQAVLKIIADDTVEMPSQTIKFSPLPFPSNLILSSSLPFTDKEFTIYSPRIQEENLSAAQNEAKKLINPETKIKINFWAFALFLMIIIVSPIFIILNFINLRKIRWMQNEQSLLLKKMFPPNFNRQN